MAGHFHEDLGAWISLSGQPASKPRAALFLDRDGVIIEDPGYLCHSSEMALISGAAEFIAAANRRGIPVIAVTNQAGIGRGYYGWQEFTTMQEALDCELAKAGAALDAILACPFHPKGVSPWGHPDHPARKPRPGMLLAAERLLTLDLKRSWIIGDRFTDLLAGHAAGLRGGMHVLTGNGRNERARISEWHPQNFDLRLGTSIDDADGLLLMLS